MSNNKPQNTINKDEVLDSTEVVELVEMILSRFDFDPEVASGLVALFHTIEVYIQSDAPKMLEDITMHGVDLALQYTMDHADHVMEEARKETVTFKNKGKAKDEIAKEPKDILDAEILDFKKENEK